MGLQRLFNSADDELFYKSHLSNEKFNLNVLYTGRTTLEYVLMQRNYAGLYDSPWSRVLSAAYSLSIGLYKSDRTQLTLLSPFTNLDEFTKRGTLLLDTAAINNEFAGAVTELTGCILEVLVTETGGEPRVMYRNTAVTLRKAIITISSVSDNPTLLYATQEYVKGAFVPKDGTSDATPCEEFYMKTSPGGLNARVWIDDQGRIQTELF
jgi:hypothetical protein